MLMVPSGGHTCFPGSNNITDGITIDLGLMDKTEYSSETQLASIQPGGRWTDVYAYLEKRKWFVVVPCKDQIFQSLADFPF